MKNTFLEQEEKIRNLDLIKRVIEWYQDSGDISYCSFGTQYKNIELLYNTLISVLPTNVKINIENNYILIHKI
jgi:hypothetical protein